MRLFFLTVSTAFKEWENAKDGSAVKWKLVDGAMEVVRGTGTIQTKRKLGFGQYHVEWRTPKEVKGSVQGRGIPVSSPWAAPRFRYWTRTTIRPIPMDRRVPSITVTLLSSMHVTHPEFGRPMTLSYTRPSWIRMESRFVEALTPFCTTAY